MSIRVCVLYHYLHPDDVVSARHFSDLCEDLAAYGYEVEALPSNRSCREEKKSFAPTEAWRGVSIHRVWRPPFRQATTLGRLLNSGWMFAAWSRIALRAKKDSA